MKNTIDGIAFRDMMLSAAYAIELNKDQVNELNVFPVPDGDTGTNMSLTMASASAELAKNNEKSIGRVAEISAGALLRGARGNSGVILSLLFRGLAKSLKEKDSADGFDFAAALSEGVEAAYKAVMKPAEGTILTVSRVSSAHALQSTSEISGVEAILDETVQSAKAALEETVNQNPVLQKAGVIDAGAKGYVIILEGMLAALRGVKIEAPAKQPARERAVFSDFETEDILFAYCTEFAARRESDKNPDQLRRFLSELGDSLVVVDDDEIIKVHVHTNNPGTVIEEALTYGSLMTVKIENMRMQHTGKILQDAEMPRESARRIAAAEKTYGFVAVCAGEGIESIFRDLGTDGIIQGGQTMNPSTENILLEIDKTPSEVVFVLPNNRNIIMAAQQCVPLSEKRVIVLPTKTMPQGITAMLAMDASADVETNLEEMGRAISNVVTMQITYAARNSEFDGHSISQGDYIALTDNTFFGTNRDITRLLRDLAASVCASGREYINIFYGDDTTEQQAQDTLEIFSQACPSCEINLLYGGQPVYYYMISAE